MPISQEMIDIIISLACKRDLKTSLCCALVSKAFVPATQKEMFYRLFIHDYTFGQPPSRSAWHTLPATLKFFCDSPHISSCPQVLCYRAHPDVSVARLKRLLSQVDQGAHIDYRVQRHRRVHAAKFIPIPLQLLLPGLLHLTQGDVQAPNIFAKCGKAMYHRELGHQPHRSQ